MSWISEYLLQQSLQISVLFAAVLLATWLLRNASAHWRYSLWLLVVAKCLVPAYFCLQLAVWPASVAEVPETPTSSAATETLLATHDANAFPSRPNAQASNSSSNVVANEPVAALPAPQASPPTTSSAIPLHQPTDAAMPTTVGGGPIQIWLALLWLLPVGLLVAFSVVKALTIRQRLVRQRILADSETTECVRELARQLGIKKCPSVFQTQAAAQPFVWGWLRGSIYLPVGFAESCSDEQQKAVLTHELAHVARFDAGLNLLQIAAQILFFFHPLVWWANKRIREEREKCCDEIVIAGLGTKPQHYCEAIVEMLAREVQARQATPGLTTAGSTRKIEDRINTLLTPDRKFRRRPARLALVCLGFLGIVTLSTSFALTHRSHAQEKTNAQESKQELAQETPEATTESKWEPGKMIAVTFVDSQTGNPIEGVKLHGDLETNIAGTVNVPTSKLPATAVRMYPVKTGYIPIQILWESEPCALVPDAITIPMQTGKTIGGTIVDEAGEPIPGVAVRAEFWGDFEGLGVDDDPKIRTLVRGSTTTDMSGNWELDTFPKEMDDDSLLNIYVQHPDFVSDRQRNGFIGNPVVTRPPIAKLYDQTSTMTMEKGESFAGQVVDENDRPIPNASIHIRDHYWNEVDGPRATTDEDGQFRIGGIQTPKPRRGFDDSSLLTLTVEAEGYAPDLIKVHNLANPVTVKLSPGNTTTIRIVDDAGKPLEGVSIYGREWRGEESRIHVVAKSDEEGRIELTDLPFDDVLCNFWKEGHVLVEKYSLTPQDEEIIITMETPLKVTGLVIDKVTGKQLDVFTMKQGIDHQDGRNTHWLNFREANYTNGRYETDFNQMIAYRVRIEAPGYMPAESRIFKPHDPDTGVLTWDVELEKADPIFGTVHGLDGKPLANATVYQATHLIQISDGGISYVDRQQNFSVQTNEEGRFELPPENQPYCLVVEHENGVAMLKDIDHEESTPITIKKWETITEVLFNISRRPSKNGQKADFPPQDD